MEENPWTPERRSLKYIYAATFKTRYFVSKFEKKNDVIGRDLKTTSGVSHSGKHFSKKTVEY